MGLVKTRRLAYSPLAGADDPWGSRQAERCECRAMRKQQREDGIDERKFTITKIVYREGGYFGRPSAFAIDVRAGTFTCGMCEEMFGHGAELIWSPSWKVPDSDRARFLELVEACDFLAWQDSYEIQCCDGTQWELEVKSGRRKLRRIHGSNAWPDQWQAVLRLLEFCHSPVDFSNETEDGDAGALVE